MNEHVLPRCTDLPAWLFCDGPMHAVHVGSQLYTTDGCAIFAVSNPVPPDSGDDCSSMIPHLALLDSATVKGPYTMGAEDGDDMMVSVGCVKIGAKYFCTVERAYPGCRWHGPKAGHGPVQAVQCGRVVALVMGLKDSEAS